MTRGRAGVVAAIAIVALAVATAMSGCGPDKPDPIPPSPPPQAGFTRVLGSGFTLDIPAGWQQPALNPTQFAETVAALRASNPRLADALEVVRNSLGQGSRLFAVDPSDGSSINLVVSDSGKRSLNALVDDGVRQLTTVGVNAPRREPASIGTRAAVRLSFTLTVTGTSGSLAVPEQQYYAVRSGRLFILTLFGGAQQLSAVADSLRLS